MTKDDGGNAGGNPRREMNDVEEFDIGGVGEFVKKSEVLREVLIEGHIEGLRSELEDEDEADGESVESARPQVLPQGILGGCRATHIQMYITVN